MILPMFMPIVFAAADPFEEFFYLTLPIFYVLGMVLTVVFPLTVFLFWKRIMPPILRTLFWAFRRREPLLLLCHDSGRSILTTIAERQGEGIVITAQGKYKILPRFAPKLPLRELIMKGYKEIAEQAVRERQHALAAAALPANMEEEEGAEGQQIQEDLSAEGQNFVEPNPYEVVPTLDMSRALTLRTLKDDFLLDYSDYVNKRSLLIGLDLPIFVGYTGKLCLLNPEALALYESGDMVVKTTDAVAFNPNNVSGKHEVDAMQPLLLMNPRKIQEIIHDGFDQSQIAGVVADSEELERVRLSGGGMFGGKMKYIIILGIMAAAGVAGLLLLPQLTGQAKAALEALVLGGLI